MNLSVVRHHPIDRFSAFLDRQSKEMVIGVVGSISHIKGREHVLNLLRYMDEHELDARLVVVGDMGGVPYSSKRISITGQYAHAGLPKLLQRHHVTVAFFPSICPETFGFVVQELMLLGLPVACFGLGAQAEYVAQYKNGLVIRSMDASDVWLGLKRLHDAT